MQSVVDLEEAFFSVAGDKQRLCLAGCGTAVFKCVEADGARCEIGAIVATVETFFFTALNVRANTALTDRGEGAAVIVGSAGAAPLSQEAVITGEAAIRDRVDSFAGDGNECSLLTGAILDSGAVVSVFGIEGVFLECLAGKALTLTTECLALGDGTFRYVTMSVKRLALCGDTSAAVTGFLVFASGTV